MKDDSDRILRMLDRYYDGVASPEEVGALSDFFRKTDMALLPEDLRADAEMFRRLEADLSELEVDVPQGLEDDIRSAVVGLGSPTAGTARHRGRIIRLAKDSYIEINSPDEATMLAQDAFSLIRDKLALAKNSIADVNGGLNQMGETMQSAIID